MIRAFFVKDLRLVSRGGTPLPGVASLLMLQAAVCIVLATVSIVVGPLPSEVWRAAASLVATVAFVLAFIMPATQAAFATASEGNPEVAESLATSPLGPTSFLLGKAAMPVVQGIAMQAALLPMWAFLTANGMIAAADVFRIVVAMLVAVPMSAVSGAARFGGFGSSRIALMVKAATRRGAVSPNAVSPAPAQQTWVALLGMAWMVQVMRGAGLAVPGLSTPEMAALQDLVRPLIPLVGMERGNFSTWFGLPVPVVLLSVLLLSALGVTRLAASVATSARATELERRSAWRALVAGRSIFVLHLAGALWAISPAVSASAAGCAAVWYALVGYPVLGSRVRIAAAALVPCVLPAIGTTIAGASAAGPGALACWLGIAAACFAGAAALPPPRIGSDRRALAVAAVGLAGIAGPVLTFAVTAPASPLEGFAALGPLFAVLSWVSLPAAVVSLASDLLGPLYPWAFLVRHAPTIAAVPPWLAAPACFGLIALIAIARSSLNARPAAPPVG